jgi:hypothetical protein
MHHGNAACCPPQSRVFPGAIAMWRIATGLRIAGVLGYTKNLNEACFIGKDTAAK